jgi:hypothetical protein
VLTAQAATVSADLFSLFSLRPAHVCQPLCQAD